MILKFLSGPKPRTRRQRGQGLILFALMFVVFIGIVGLATDSAVAYAYSVSLERAASAAALSGVPYMLPPPGAPGPLAIAKACEEARRNGYVDNLTCGFSNPNATLSAARNGDRDMVVKITTTVPTYFMAALGLAPFPTSREAVAGYLPPISLGQPGPQLGATVSQLGTANQFYIQRFKAYNKYRSEGDAYTPSPFEGSGTPATDVHFISNVVNNESGALNNSADPKCGGVAGAYAMPCNGGQNYRITIPPGATGEIQVYNAAFAPDFNIHSTYKPNQCENYRGLPAAQCSSSGNYTMKEGQDDGMGGNDPLAGTNPPGFNPVALSQAHCGARYGIDCGQNLANGANGSPPSPARKPQDLYNAVGYTVLAVPDIFLRSNDVVLTQSVVKPIDATNYDGNEAQSGIGSAATPTYVNVMAKLPAPSTAYGPEITQTYGNAPYDIGGSANNPLNMRIHRSWTNIVREDGTGDTCAAPCTSPVTRNQNDTAISCPSGAGTGAYSCYVNNFSLREGTYRLRVDSLNADGTIGKNGDASKAYAVRVTKPGTPPDKDPSTDASVKCGAGGVDCTIAAWEDMCVYTPIAAGTGTIPLFQLTPDYRGAILEVEVYDVGDASGLVDLAIIDPVTGLIAKLNRGGVGDYNPSIGRLQIFNQGDSRFGAPLQHIGPQNPSGALPAPPNGEITPHLFQPDDTYAALESTAPPAHFNGEWVRFEIPVSDTFSSPLFWKLQYSGAGANDTFTFAVRAKGGPVHLLRS